VEDELFCVARNELAASSEVFSDMFLLPTAEGLADGRDKSNAVFLEGQKKSDFLALLKVIYPTSSLEFRIGLSKEEWIGVLKLSTMWDMKEIRDFSIKMLQERHDLSAVDMIQLARACSIGSWLKQGAVRLAESDESMPLQTLTDLGWETAAIVLSIRD
ncbi:hypothetical protein FA15DRAFT_561720, partial [Coprinopsis marcescibilis]